MAKNTIGSILDQNKITDTNYLDYICNLKRVLTIEKRVYVFNEIPPDALPANATAIETTMFEMWNKDYHHGCYMLASIVLELARKYASHLRAFNIKAHLETMYSGDTRALMFGTTKS
ncbi:PREDICTED: uncharacterized protein LOC105954575 [Erythranthe guttata]|uniref:uncharacterized protein LOC105954567 n=1 Tax=Erythranthe guttata TaxID=4155 RepID=UPI00064DE7B4|nr:PREDICTED: uncharacterized protein LOC105954567 [Erythranthe guttata]XP_012833695.1 PREDICTED: uncharacterized protein LOC105954575 [Erythranthe guttata]|eukprot:XP_012833690.1 PREDICTED: uncharacterized protein LOC105954567 [Erythranthe guttata]